MSTWITLRYAGDTTTHDATHTDAIHECLHAWLIDQPVAVIDDVCDFIDDLLDQAPPDTPGVCSGVTATITNELQHLSDTGVRAEP